MAAWAARGTVRRLEKLLQRHLRLKISISGRVRDVRRIGTRCSAPPVTSFPLLGVRRSSGPFAGLVVCVTGLSKEARGQVKEAAERLGGEYSGSLHPKCTHLVVQSFAGRKFEHALKHGPRNGLFVVTLGWFVDCVRRNMRLDESLYSIKNIGENGRPLGDFNRLVGTPVDEKSCLPPMVFQDKACSDASQRHQLQAHREGPEHDVFVFTDHTIYIDPEISGEMKKKISDAATKECIIQRVMDESYMK